MKRPRDPLRTRVVGRGRGLDRYPGGLDHALELAKAISRLGQPCQGLCSLAGVGREHGGTLEQLRRLTVIFLLEGIVAAASQLRGGPPRQLGELGWRVSELAAVAVRGLEMTADRGSEAQVGGWWPHEPFRHATVKHGAAALGDR